MLFVLLRSPISHLCAFKMQCSVFESLTLIITVKLSGRCLSHTALLVSPLLQLNLLLPPLLQLNLLVSPLLQLNFLVSPLLQLNLLVSPLLQLNLLVPPLATT